MDHWFCYLVALNYVLSYLQWRKAAPPLDIAAIFYDSRLSLEHNENSVNIHVVSCSITELVDQNSMLKLYIDSHVLMQGELRSSIPVYVICIPQVLSKVFNHSSIHLDQKNYYLSLLY